MRCWVLSCYCVASPLHASPTAAVFRLGPETRAAALDGPVVHFAALRDGRLTALPDLPAPGLTTLAAGPRGSGLYAGRGDRVLRLDGVAWVERSALGDLVQQLLAAPDGASALVVLTGRPAEPVLAGGKVWRLPLVQAAKAVRVDAVHDSYRPWALHRAAVGDEPRLAVNTYRATRFAPFEHKCFFLYRLQGEACEPAWLGSRLSRPYVDASMADLRGDGRWRIVAVEETEGGGAAVGVYRPIGFGYEGEWRSEAVQGLSRVVADGPVALLWGRSAGRPWLRQVLAEGEGYRLAELPAAPPASDRVALAGGSAVWYDKGWRDVPLPGATRP